MGRALARGGDDAYRIVDEPRPGPLAQIAVNPLWPLLAIMFGGPWLAWPWHVLNAFAIGSATRWRELVIAVVGFLGACAILAALLLANSNGVLSLSDRTHAQFSMLALTVCQLAVSYTLYTLQEPSFELHEYFGGVARNGGVFVLMAAFMLKDRHLEALPDFLRIVLR